MIVAWLLAACVGWSGEPTSDRVLLKDGRELLGLATSPTASPRVGFDMLVRREWAEARVPDLAARWIRNAETMRKPIVAARRRRLESWRAERKAAVGEDRVTAWITAELKRLEDPRALESPLLTVRIARDGCRSVELASDASRRLLALAWTCGFPDPEARTVAELRDAVESRGFVADGTDFPSLEKLKPMAAETEAKWLARRAATELLVDPGRRFLRYQGMLIPEPTDGARLDANAAPDAIAGLIGRLLDPNAAETDPLAPALAAIGREGGVGAVVTRLDMAPDFSRVGVEIALWVRGPNGWAEHGARNAVVRPEDVPKGAADAIAADPGVKSVFDLAGSLLPGAVSAEMKDRSLRMGAATERALGTARNAFNAELGDLALPAPGAR